MAAVAAGSRTDGPAALMPPAGARLLGFAALAALGALEWQRLVFGLSSGRALLWLLAGVATAVAVEKVGRRGRGTLALAATAGVALGMIVSGLDLALLGPRALPDTLVSLAGGAHSLGTVRLPYIAVDPWPRLALQLMGAELVVAAALLAFWPRAGARGYPFLALVALLVLVASPVISLGGGGTALLGLVLAGFTVCFLWLERLPLKPGIGVAALLGLALAGALPLAGFADRGEPWFDYRSFAEGLGPDDPVHFSWAQSYGPITWPRDGNEILRVSAPQATPSYWKAADLDVFDGRGWAERTRPERLLRQGDRPWEADVPEDWRNRPAWTETLTVTVRRVRLRDVVGAGTIMSVADASRAIVPGPAAGTWRTIGELRRGDSYTVTVHAPRPDGTELQQASTGLDGQQGDDLAFTVPFLRGTGPQLDSFARPLAKHVRSATIHLPPYGGAGTAFAAYPAINRSEFNVAAVMRRTPYERTWRLAQRLKRGTHSPFGYIQRVNAYLQGPDFRYSERPTAPAPGRAPLDAFLFDTHEGYCQHYAGAMALLLRMGGIPARVATGFSPGGYSARKKAWVVRDTDAHAWVEAWFDRFGWVTFDPTPDATPARSQIAALEAPPPPASSSSNRGSTTGGGARGNAAGRRGGLRGDLRFDPLRSADTSGRAAAGVGAGPPWWAWAAVALTALALAAVLVAWVRRRRARRGLSPADAAIAELEEALRRSGRPLPTGTTLRQLERRLGDSDEVVAYLRALSGARYGRPGAPAAHPRDGRRALRRAIQAGLGPAGRLKALWALPPRVR